MSVGPCPEKLNVVSNDRGCTQKCDFSVLYWKYPLWANLVQIIKIVSSSWNLVHKINSNIQNSVMVFTFSIFDQKYPFWVNLVQKIKIASLSWNFVPRLIQISRIQCDVHFFCFQSEIPFLGRFGPENQKRQLKVKVCANSNSNIQILIVVFFFFVCLFETENTLFGQICTKSRNCQFKLKCGT